MEKQEQKFCGILIFTWEQWDDVDADMLQFYNVEFPMESMKKYNGCDVSLTISGELEVYGSDYFAEPLWNGYVTDIVEIMEELKNRF